MADVSITEEEEELKNPVSISDQLNTIISLAEEKGNDEAINDLLRSSQGLLHEACNQGSVTAVKCLLTKGVATSEWNTSFLLPLHIVARNNLLEIAQILLEHNSEGVDRPSKFGETPLHFACMKGHKKMVELLVRYKANVERRDHCENTTLHYAVASNDPDLVEWLLRDKNMYEQINAKNRFSDTPLHRAVILQSVEVIPVLIKYRVKLSSRDQFGFKAHDIATILYNNIKLTTLPNGERKIHQIVPTSLVTQLPPLIDHDRARSSSFSVPINPTGFKQDGSTISLPVAGGNLRKKPSATQARRPVNLTFSNEYNRQTSGMSTGSSSVEGSRSSVYLRDKDQASHLSQVLDNQYRSVEDVHKVVRDQTAYDPPVDMYFVGDVQIQQLTQSSPKHFSKDHEILVKINEKYWIHDAAEVIESRLTASLHWNYNYPSGYAFVSPIYFLSFKANQPVEVTVTLPHALCINVPNDTQLLKRLVIFASPIAKSRHSHHSPPEFRRITTSDLAFDNKTVTCVIKLSDPVLLAVGFALSVGTMSSPTHLPTVPLRCCLYVACPSDPDQYLTSTDVWVYVGMSLKTVETAMKKHVVPHDFTLEEKRFVLNGPVLSVDGEVDNSQYEWQSSRRGSGLFRYSQIALGQDNFQEVMSHHEIYPSKEAFFVECHNPKKALKFRVSASCDNSELVNMLVTPYVPPKVATQFGMTQIREVSNSPVDLNSSTDSIPLKTSSV